MTVGTTDLPTYSQYYIVRRCAPPDWDGSEVNKLFQDKVPPILGCIVVDILIRWIEDSGDGIYHPVEYQQVS
jgi:hypothetical protein